MTITTSTIPAHRDADGLAVIGRTKHALMGIRYADGDGAGAPVTPPVVETPPVAPVVEQPKPAPPVEPETVEGSADGGKTFDSAYVEKLRKEAAKNRVDDKAAIQTQIDTALATGQKAWATELGKALGIIEAEGEQTPEQIIAALTTERDTFKTERDQFATVTAQRTERDAIEGASKANGGDFALVRAVLASDGLLKDIDPTATDYAAQVAVVVKAEIEKNPKLREVQVAPSSGGGNNPPAGAGASQLTRAEFAALSPTERLKAHSEGRTRGFTK